MHVLQTPVVLHELYGEPVEQLGMSGRLALNAEVVGRRHNSHAEMMLPEAIHHDTRG